MKRDFMVGSSNTRARWVRWAGWFCTQNVNALNSRDWVEVRHELYKNFLRKLATGKKDEFFYAVTPVRAPVKPFGQGLVLFDRSSPVGFSIVGNDLETEAHIALANHIVAGGIVLDQIRICPECNNLVIIETK